MNKIQNKKAFTLVELLIVITIIGILFVVLISRVDFARDKAKTTGVNTDFREYEIAFQTAAGNGQGFDPLFVDTAEVKAADGTRVKDPYSAAENLLAAINKNLDDAMQLKLAYGKSYHDVDGSLFTGDALTTVDLGMTLDYKDAREGNSGDNAGNGVGCVFVTEKLDPWNEQYIVYYVQGQMETVSLGDGANEKTVVRDVADGTLHGNRGCLCMISKGIDVDEMLVWDDTAIDDTYDYTKCYTWNNAGGKIADDKTIKPGEWAAGSAPAWVPTSGNSVKYGAAADTFTDKYLPSGSFVPAKGSDDLVLTVSYSFASGRGVATIKTFGFEGNID